MDSSVDYRFVNEFIGNVEILFRSAFPCLPAYVPPVGTVTVPVPAKAQEKTDAYDAVQVPAAYRTVPAQLRKKEAALPDGSCGKAYIYAFGAESCGICLVMQKIAQEFVRTAKKSPGELNEFWSGVR